MKRHRYQGVIQIVRFNWHQYVVGATVCTAAGWVWWRVPLPAPLGMLLGAGAGLAVFWLLTSLIVSHYVYDLSGFGSWDWVGSLFPIPPDHWASIHCGFDETSSQLKRVFPNTRYLVLDIFDGDTMTEPSIRRARRYDTHAPIARRARFDNLPVEGGQMAAVFVLFAAHELRDRRARRAFFCELYRALAPGGRLLLVEHLRDAWNFLAFGPGCWHFLPRGEWMERASEPGFRVEQELRKTPFVRVWLLRKDG